MKEEFGMNKNSNNGTNNSLIHRVSKMSQISNMVKTRLRYGRDMFRER
jgi:hypothetical protein